MTSPFLEAFLARLHGVKQSGHGWTARCPAHEDAKNSLSVGVGDDGRVRRKSSAGWQALRDSPRRSSLGAGSLYRGAWHLGEWDGASRAATNLPAHTPSAKSVRPGDPRGFREASARTGVRARAL